MEEFIALWNKVSGASLALILALILFGNWKGVWTWSREVRAVRKRCEEDLAAERERTEWWRSMALRAMGVNEIQSATQRKLVEKLPPETP